MEVDHEKEVNFEFEKKKVAHSYSNSMFPSVFLEKQTRVILWSVGVGVTAIRTGANKKGES